LGGFVGGGGGGKSKGGRSGGREGTSQRYVQIVKEKEFHRMQRKGERGNSKIGLGIFWENHAVALTQTGKK